MDPAALHINNPQGPGQQAQENYQGNEQVFPTQTEDQGDGHNYLAPSRFTVSHGSVTG